MPPWCSWRIHGCVGWCHSGLRPSPGDGGGSRHQSRDAGRARRPAPVSGRLASGTGVDTKVTVTPAPATAPSASHPGGSHGPSRAHGLGLASRGNGQGPGAPAHRHAQGACAGPEWVADRQRPRDPAATRLWDVVAGTSADLLATRAALWDAPPAPPSASGHPHTSLAHRSRTRVALHGVGGSMQGARGGHHLTFG